MKKIPLTMNPIKEFSYVLFKILMGDIYNYVISVTLRFIFCERNVTFQIESFTEEPSILLNEFM